MKIFRKKHFLSGLLLIFMTLVMVKIYWPTIVNRGFVTYVNHARFYPRFLFLIESWQTKQWPLWNPYLRFGTPYINDPTNLPLYPLIVFPVILNQLGLDNLSAYNYYIFFHYLLSVFSFYFLARYHQLDRLPAAFAAFIYHFGLPAVHLKRDEIYLVSYAWLPLVTLITFKVFQTKKPLSFVFYLILISLYLNFAFGYYQMYYLIALIACFLFVNYQYFKKHGRWTLGYLKRLAVMSVIFIPLLLPNLSFFQYFRNTPRSVGEYPSLYNGQDLLNDLKGYPFLNFSNQLKGDPFWHYRLGPVTTLPFLLFILAFISGLFRKRKILLFYFLLIVGSFVYCLLFMPFEGNAFTKFAEVFPGGKAFSKHNRVFILFLFSVAISAAFSLQELATKMLPKKRQVLQRALLFVLVITATIMSFIPHNTHLFEASHEEEITFIGGSRVVNLTQEELTFLKKDNETSRLYGFFNNSLSPILYQIQSPGGRIQNKSEMMSFHKFWQDREKNLETTVNLDSNRYDLVNIKYFLLGDYFWEFFPDTQNSFKTKKMAGNLYLNEDYLPRVVLFSDYFVAFSGRPSQPLSLTKVFLKSRPSLNYSTKALQASESAVIEKYNFNLVEIKAKVIDNRLLFISDTFYNGWQAFIDGKKVRTLKAFDHFRAIELSPGEHQVIFKYQPAMIIHLRIYLITVIVLLLLAWYYRKHELKQI